MIAAAVDRVVARGDYGAFGFNDGSTPVCTSVDPGPGIGIGAGQVNSALCTPSTLLPGADQNRYVFADKIYITPAAHRQFGNSAYTFLHLQW